MTWTGNELDKEVVERHFVPAVDTFRNQLGHPEAFVCQVASYSMGQSILRVDVYHPETSTRHELLFGSVIHFSGSMTWLDASLFVRPYDEAVRFYNHIVEKQNSPHENLGNYVCLYQFGATEPITTILAWNFYVDPFAK
ncbi:MAG: hypothetical protein RLP44_08175 [Aggregatilineales bacterium]